MIHYTACRPSESTEGSKPPVLIVLHGYGADENDLLSVARDIDPRFLVLSLQGPITLPWGGYAWYHLQQTAGGILPDDHSRHDSERLVVGSLLGIVESEGGDLERVVLLGFSQGAAMIYALLASHKLEDYGIHVRGAIAMSGYLPRDILDEVRVRNFRHLPFFLSHGEYDDLIPPIALEEAERMISESNGDVESHRYPIGHGINEATLADLKRWAQAHRLAERD